jgi:hypothetical protein
VADNTAISPQAAGGDVIATDDISGVKHQLVKLEYGLADSATQVSPTTPLPVAVRSNTVTGGGPSSVTAAITDTLILAANTARLGILLFNDSTATLSLSYGTNAASSTARSLLVSANGYVEVPFGWTGQIRGIWSAANGAVRITEFT